MELRVGSQHRRGFTTITTRARLDNLVGPCGPLSKRSNDGVGRRLLLLIQPATLTPNSSSALSSTQCHRAENGDVIFNT